MSNQQTPYLFDDLPLLAQEQIPVSEKAKPAKPAKKVTKPIAAPAEMPEEKPMEKEHIFTVGQFLDLINTRLKPLETIIQGEIGKVDMRGSAVYFTMNDKNEKATLSCIVWRNKLASMGLELREGLEVKVVGVPNVYKPMGKLSFEAQYISPVGEGALKMAFENLKRLLQEKGYFDISRKRPIPTYPSRIGLVTSANGDARRDFETHLGKFGYKIYFYDVRVEGVKSIPSVVEGIHWFNEHNINVDVLVVTRGGGSLESLQAFNSEEVAKAIFSSRVPVISAIGHERDVTIADLVADARASTPTHAGKILSQYWTMAAQAVDAHEQTITTVFKNRCTRLKQQLDSYQSNWTVMYTTFLRTANRRLDDMDTSLTGSFRAILKRVRTVEETFLANYDRMRSRIGLASKELLRVRDAFISGAECMYAAVKKHVDYAETTLTLCDPQLKLKQGYSIVKNTDGKVLKSSAAVQSGDIITVQLHEGSLSSQVTEKR